MKCEKCQRELAGQTVCECEADTVVAKPALWVLMVIFVTGALAIYYIWTRPKQELPEAVPATIHLSQGKDLLLAQNYAAAVTELEEAAQAQPKDGLTRRLLAEALLGNGQKKEAANQIKTAAELAPDDYEIQQMYGESLEDTATPELALKQFQTVIARFPDKAPAYGHAASLQDKLGDKRAALESWRLAVKKDPHDENARKELKALSASLEEGK